MESLEAQAEVAGDLADSSSGSSSKIEERFKSLEAGSRVDDELERMKRQVGDLFISIYL